jgi:hypothetical protein
MGPAFLMRPVGAISWQVQLPTFRVEWKRRPFYFFHSTSNRGVEAGLAPLLQSLLTLGFCFLASWLFGLLVWRYSFLRENNFF